LKSRRIKLLGSLKFFLHVRKTEIDFTSQASKFRMPLVNRIGHAAFKSCLFLECKRAEQSRAEQSRAELAIETHPKCSSRAVSVEMGVERVWGIQIGRGRNITAAFARARKLQLSKNPDSVSVRSDVQPPSPSHPMSRPLGSLAPRFHLSLSSAARVQLSRVTMSFCGRRRRRRRRILPSMWPRPMGLGPPAIGSPSPWPLIAECRAVFPLEYLRAKMAIHPFT
jgi:hypothetical protein